MSHTTPRALILSYSLTDAGSVMLRAYTLSLVVMVRVHGACLRLPTQVCNLSRDAALPAGRLFGLGWRSQGGRQPKLGETVRAMLLYFSDQPSMISSSRGAGLRAFMTIEVDRKNRRAPGGRVQSDSGHVTGFYYSPYISPRIHDSFILRPSQNSGSLKQQPHNSRDREER